MNVAREGRGTEESSHPKLILYSHDVKEKSDKDCLEK